MNYIIMDMEWNQALYPGALVREPFCLYGEIIRIGAVKVNDSFEMEDTFQAAIKPKYYRRMNRAVKRLTSINNDDLKVGISFKAAAREFRQWCGEEPIFLTWGDNDMAMLRDNLRFFCVEEDWDPPYYNAQKIFDMQIAKMRTACSLSKAVAMVGEEGLPDHDAFNDALDTYKVISHLDMAEGMKTLDEIGAASYFVDCENLDMEKVCESASEMKADPELKTFFCKECEAETVTGKWISQGAGKVISLATCENGHSWFVRLNYTKNNDGTRRVRRMIYPLTEERNAVYEKCVTAEVEFRKRQNRKRRRRNEKDNIKKDPQEQ